MSDVFEFEIPIKVIAGDNEHEHWRHKAARVKRARADTAMCWRDAKVRLGRPPPLPVVVTFVRIAPSALDAGDNLNASFKPVRDQIADELGLKSDRAKGVEWRYGGQEVRGVREYAVRVRVEMVSAATEGPRCSKCGGEMVPREAYAALEERLRKLEERTT